MDATYDARGNVLTEASLATTGALATTSYAWDPIWDAMTSVRNPEGDSTTFGIDATSGRRHWQQDARGSTVRTTYTYDATTHLVASMTLLGASPQTFDHDPVLGNTSGITNELDHTTLFFSNAIGLDTLVQTPYGTRVGRAPRASTRPAYSERNEVLATSNSAGSKSTTVTNTYDAEGNPLTLTRTCAVVR